MYQPVYGNYIGIVVNDQDPEHRSRLQIFIPNLSNTLYSNWNDRIANDNVTDISFRTFESGIFTPDVVQKLKNVLPWAEGAVPSFGGGTSGIVNSSVGKAFTNMGKALTSIVSGGQNTTDTTTAAGDATSPLYANKNGDPKAVNSLQSTAGYNSQSLTDALMNARANGTLTSIQNTTQDARDISADANGNAQTYVLEGFAGNPKTGPMTYKDGSAIDGMKTPFLAVENTSDVGKWFSVQLNGNPPVLMLGVDPSTTSGRGRVIGQSSVGLNNYHAEPSVAGLIALGGGVSQSRSGLLTGTTLAQGDTLHIAPINDPSLPQFSISNKPTQEQLDSLLNSQLSDTQKNQLDKLVSNAAANGGESMIAGNSSSTSKPVQRQFAATQEPADIHAKGFFSKPAVGCKVWVFFHGGDIQRPVYFATAVEANGSVAAYQTV